ncbi:hypothetical protein J0S82_019886 [Galemys pyrenaicus]|uniref:Uncharacterized protein n=1 Tax=Galemys pyrenaicus TaxID=202257 RepID=A0A8J6DUP1_GALPY|nr:hypothetical protein J0S82_019886 [Galemys pyrenaicus]
MTRLERSSHRTVISKVPGELVAREGKCTSRARVAVTATPVHCGRTVRCSFAIRPPPGPGRTETLRRLYCRFVMWRSRAV